MAILSCGLMIMVTGVSVRVMARTEGLHLIGQSWVVASGAFNLVLRV